MRWNCIKNPTFLWKYQTKNFKMAEEQLEGVITPMNIVRNLERKEGIKCQCCDKLKTEIHKAKLDITSYEEIIKILLEEQSSSQLKLMKADRHSSNEGSFHQVSRGSLIKTLSRLGNKRNNLIQIIPTANKFGVLANLNEVSEPLSALIDGDITSRNFKKKNQKKIKRRLKDSTVQEQGTRELY